MSSDSTLYSKEADLRVIANTRSIKVIWSIIIWFGKSSDFKISNCVKKVFDISKPKLVSQIWRSSYSFFQTFWGCCSTTSTPLSVALLSKVNRERNNTNVIFPFPAAENLSLANISKSCCLYLILSKKFFRYLFNDITERWKKIFLPVKKALLELFCVWTTWW